jgi:uncharacterized Zn-binding protein involved in type VI secretion
MLPIARMGDMVLGTCTAHKRPITTIGYIYPTFSKVLVNTLPISRMGDMVITACGHIGYVITGSSTVFAENLPVAKMGSMVGMGPFSGIVINGSSNVFCK